MRFQRSLLVAILLLGLSGAGSGSLHVQAAPAKPKATTVRKAPAKKPVAPAASTAKTPEKEDLSYKPVQPLDLLREADQWDGEKVSFEGSFVSFSPYALDYKGAMRPSKDYIAFLIQRPDVSHHVIPLSELKLIFPRKKAEKVMDLENGDKIRVKAKVFSTALGDPWLDVEEVKVLQKNPANVDKDKKKARAKDME